MVRESESGESGTLPQRTHLSAGRVPLPTRAFPGIPRLFTACVESASSTVRRCWNLSLRSKLALLVATLGVLVILPEFLILSIARRHHPSAPIFHHNLAFILISLLVRVVAVYYLTFLITRPLEYLAGVARAVSSRRDYSVRAHRAVGGELGALIDAFNQLLDHIQQEDLFRRATEQQLRQSEARYALAVRGSNNGLWDADIATGVTYHSPRLNAMLGDPEVESWVSMQEWVSRIHPADRVRIQAEIDAFTLSTHENQEMEFRIRKADGSYLWVLSHGAAVRDVNGLPLRVAGSLSDITQSKTTDSLTGLPNRLFFLDATTEALHRDDRPVAVLLLDLDNFILFMDSLGRPAGDDLLAQVAARLRTLARLASPSCPLTVARTGEDDFAILLAFPDAPSEAPLVAARLLDALHEPFFIEGRRLAVTCSIGIAFGCSPDDPESLLHNAQTAMFQASAAGKSQFAVFRSDMRQATAARLDVITGLRSAIDRGQLRLYYQPIVSVPHNRIIGFESLVRWQHPERGLLSPAAFIPIAEESDLILDLGQWVLREACRQMAAWHDRFPSGQPLQIGVNLSARQLNDSHLADEVALILRQTGLDPRTLRLEITESALVSNSDAALATLRVLQRLNVGLIIDDFGTGYSSLSYLQRLPFTVLKIDRSFIQQLGIQQLGAGDRSPEIVRTIVQLGHSLHMRIVAEGVETADQLANVTALGCDLVQGYFFSRPVDAEQTEALIRNRDAAFPVDSVQEAALIPREPACVQPVWGE